MLDPIVGWADRSRCDRLEVTGPDRAKFLHNLTTNEVKRLDVGRGREAFVTSPQGKTIGHVRLLAAEDRILLLTDPDGLAHVIPHFEKYGLFDAVAWSDIRSTTCEHHLIGDAAVDVLQGAGGELPEPVELAHRPTTIDDRMVRVVRESRVGRPGLTVIGRVEDGPALAEIWRRAGVVELDEATFDALRIEAGTPAFGRDIRPENLPQEIDRDDRAISFVKGCYLGQETVARLDALGHVNKILRRVRVEGDADVPGGTPLLADGKPVGTITSAARPRHGDGVVALAIVRVSHSEPGTELILAGADGVRSARVVGRPVEVV